MSDRSVEGIEPDDEAAVEFLRWWRPGGPWTINAYSTDRQRVEGWTFTEEDIDRLRAMLRRENGKRNLYFTVNPLLRAIEGVGKKASREDVASLAWLHVDLDPREREDIGSERTRILGLLREPLLGIPKPTCIIFSGGGYQAFWRLEDPIPIDGKIEAAEDAKRYNLAIELALGGDHCHNVDRIMRLPGTINLPDKKKIAKGRRVELATEVERHDQRVYELRAFTPAPPVQASASPWGGEGAPGKDMQFEQVLDLDELDQWGVPSRIKVIIAQGHHPEEPPKPRDNSRSAWVFDVCCELVRRLVPDNVIYSILMDKRWGISESILEKTSSAGKYAEHQILRAREHAVHPRLAEFNTRFAVIGNISGKCVVVEEVWDSTMKRHRFTMQSTDAFRQRYEHLQVEIKVGEETKKLSAAKWWLANPMRRYYDYLEFNPGRDVGDSTYNLWRGFGVPAEGGDAHEMFLEHTREIMCCGSQECYDYVIRWLARMVQKPHLPGETALVWRGEMGIGKGLWARWLLKVMGRHAIQVAQSSHLVGNFNKHLRDAVLVYADEAFAAGDKRHESVLKTLITEPTLMIEAKGFDAESLPNYIHLIMSSNADYVVPAGKDERRYFVCDVSPRQKKNRAYFRKFETTMNGGGAECLLHFLLNVDLNGYEVRAVPQTEALRSQKEHNMSHEEEWLYSRLREGTWLPRHQSWEVEVVAADLHASYLEYLRGMNVQRRLNDSRFGRFLSQALPGLYPRHTQRVFREMRETGQGFQREEARRARVYIMPPLEEARAFFEERYGFGGDWLEEVPTPPRGGGDPPF